MHKQIGNQAMYHVVKVIVYYPWEHCYFIAAHRNVIIVGHTGNSPFFVDYNSIVKTDSDLG